MLNLILLIAFIAVLFATLIGFLVGVIKGIYKQTLKAIIKGLLILIFIFTTPAIARAVANIDFSKFGWQFSMFNETITVTTVEETLCNIITASGYFSPMNGLSIYETSIGIANSIISFVVFFTLMILIQIFASLITCIFYNCIFRFIIPVENSKERKARKKLKKEKKLEAKLSANINEKRKWPLLRLPGGLVGAAQEFLFVLILISPLTALAKTYRKNGDDIYNVLEKTGAKEETKEKFTEINSDIDSSLFYKMISITDMDMAIMNKASTVKINGTKISLAGLTSSILDIAKPLLDSDAVSFDSQANQLTINFSTLLSVDMVSALITKVLENNMLMSLIPPLIDTAVFSLTSPSLALDRLDFSNVDWSNDISILNTIYSNIYETGMIESVISEDGKEINMNDFTIPASTYSDEKIASFAAAFENLGKMDSVKENLPIIFAGLGNYLKNLGVDVLPTISSDYDDVNWADDLKILGTNLFLAFRTLGIDISTDMNVSMLRDKVLTGLKDDNIRNNLKVLIVGDPENPNIKGLIDASLFKVVKLGSLIYSVFDEEPSLRQFITNDFRQSMEELNCYKAYTEEQNNLVIDRLKSEIRSIFKVAGIIFREDSVFDFNDLSNIDLFNEESSRQLIDVLDATGESLIFNKLYPVVLKTFLFNNANQFSDYLFGLTPYDFNYESDNFINNLRQVLAILPDIKQLADLFSDDSIEVSEKIAQIDTNLIRELLNIVANSDFFNPQANTGFYSEERRNINIGILLKNLFENETFSSIGLKAPSLDTIEDISWGHGVEGDGGEIDILCKVIDIAKTNSSFFASLSSGDSALNLDKGALLDFSIAALDSSLLRPSVLSIIDEQLNKFLKDNNIPFTLDKMRNFIWKDENKDDVVEDLKNLRKVVPLLDKIDFVTFAENLHESLQTIDYQDINAILTTFYQNHLFQDDVDGDEYFAHFVNALLGFRAADVLNCYSYGESLFSPSKVGFTWLVDTGEETLVDKDGNADTYTVTRHGEIYAVSLVVRLLKDIDVKGAIDNAVIDFVTPLWVKEDTVLFSSKLVRNLVVSYAPLLEYTIFNRMGLSQTYHDCFKLIDFNVLYTLSAEEFKEECKKLKHILTSATRKVDGEYVLTKMLGNIKSINSNELFDTFEEMLLTMSTTYTLTTVKERESVSPYVFGLYHIARKAEVLNIVAGSSDEKYQQALFYGRVGKETDLYSYTVNYINIIRSIQE